MPLRFDYDAADGILIGLASGVVTAADFDPAARPEIPRGTPELLDARGVTDVEVSADDIRRLARIEEEGPNLICAMALVSRSIT